MCYGPGILYRKAASCKGRAYSAESAALHSSISGYAYIRYLRICERRQREFVTYEYIILDRTLIPSLEMRSCREALPGLPLVLGPYRNANA
jgi:hypothetical protein